MKSLNTKLVLSAVGIAMLATPAFAQESYRQAPPSMYNYQAPAYQGRGYQAYAYLAPEAAPAPSYPNPVARSGSEESVESGAAFNTGY
ncbi:MAG TPA: hypothetical protein VMF12_07945 [Xanthobacteraceae bacterium]|nr:hypothetical protein [Xanthobacteraceae bacterium]